MPRQIGCRSRGGSGKTTAAADDAGIVGAVPVLWEFLLLRRLLCKKPGLGDMATKPQQLPFDSKAFFARVGTGRTIGSYAAEQPVFRQGEAGDAVFYIQKGRVKITVVSEQGKEAVVALLGRTAFFGEGCLAGQSKRISTAVAMSDAVISRIERSTIVKLIHDEPEFSEIFIAHLLVPAHRGFDELMWAWV